MDVSLPRAVDLGVMVTMWTSTSSSYADERAMCVSSAWRMRVSRVSLWFLRHSSRVSKPSSHQASLTLSRPLSPDINITARFCTISMSCMVFLREGSHTASAYSNIRRHNWYKPVGSLVLKRHIA